MATASLKRHRGKLVVDWTDDTGKRHRERMKDRDEGNKRLQEILKVGMRAGTDKTLKEYAEWWLENVAKDSVASSTYLEYKSVLKNHVYSKLGDKPFGKITKLMVRELVAGLRKEGYEAGTVRNILAPVRGMYNQAIEDGEPIALNPAARLGKHNRRAEKKEINPLSRDEVSEMLQKALSLVPDYYALILCAVRTGMRLGELIGLKATDVDFEKRLINVQRSISRGIVKSPKSGKSRRVDMSRQLAGVLRELDRKGDEWLFTTPTGFRIDRHNLGKLWRNFLKRAELRPVRFHDLRHTFATIHLMAGRSPVYVKEQLGHSSIQVTCDVYGHFIPGGNRQFADDLDDGT